MKSRVSNLPVVKDAAERALRLITAFHSSTAPKDEDQKQCIFKVVKEMRILQSEGAAGPERVTKDTLGMRMYELL